MGHHERPWASMKNKYISVSEFAKAAGVSKQAVYSRLKSQDLNKFIKLENGKKLINTKALELFNKSSSQSSFNQVEQGLESTEREYIESLKKQIEELQRDKQELYRLLDQQQQLTAQANATIKLLQAPKEEASVIQQEQQQEQQEQKKQGFFARLFSRDN